MWQDEETHEQLMHAFKMYFKANQDWHNKGTRRAGEQSRYWLGQIRIIARERRAKIQEYRHWLDAEKRQSQNDKAQGETDTN